MPANPSPRPPRILILNPFGIGDVLFTTPLVRALRSAFPESYLGYLCNRRTELILSNNPHLDQVFVYEKDELLGAWRQSMRDGVVYLSRLLATIRRSRFNWVVDLSLGERYGLATWLVGIPRRVGFNYRKRGRFLTESLPIDGYRDDHVIEHYRRLLGFIGVKMVDVHSEMRINPQDTQWASDWLRTNSLEGRRPLVGVVPAGGVSWGLHASFRRWSSDGFADVADTLVSRLGAKVLLFGEASDQPVCAEVQNRMRQPALDVSGQTNLGQFIALLSRLDLVICNDGGPLHLAVSQGVKTVSLFGPVDPAVYGPYPPDPHRHRAIFRAELPCRPCYHQFKLPPCPYERACLTTVDPAQVVEACEALLKFGPAPAGKP